MPFINRVRVKNIGHPRAFMQDLTLDFHRGRNTIVFADNGGGKSSLISFILMLMRPSSHEFLKGESDEKRELKQYVHPNFPAHIIIEWYYDSGHLKEFLLTGMILTLKHGGDIERVFYSFRYPEEIDSEITFDTLPLEEGSYILTAKDIISRLRTKAKDFKKQDIRIFDQIGEWEKHLASHFIDPALAKMQTRMNQKEGEQSKFLSFNDDIEFMKFMVQNLEDIEDDGEFQEVHETFSQMKQVPALQSQERIILELLRLLKEGQIVEKEKSLLTQELCTLFKKWLEIQDWVKNTTEDSKKRRDELQNKVSELTQKIKENNQLIIDLEQSVAFLKYSRKSITVEGIEKDLQKLEQEISKYDEEKKYLTVLPTYIDITKVSDELKILHQKSDEQIGPLMQEIGTTTFIVSELLRETIRNTGKTLSSLTSEFEDLKAKFDSKNMDLGSFRGQKSELEKNIEKNTKRIQIFQTRVEKIAFLLKPEENVSQAIFRLETNLADLKEQEKNLLEQLDTARIIIEQKRTNLDTMKGEIAKQSNVKEITSTEINHIIADWQKIIQSIQFRIQFGPNWEMNEVNYDVLSEMNFKVIAHQMDIIRDDLFQVKTKLEDLKQKLDYYGEKKSLPYPEELNSLFTTLEKEDFNVQVGWEYLKKTFPRIEDRAHYAKKFSHLLNGIIIISESIEPVQKYLQSKADSGEFASFHQPVYISTTNIFKNINQEMLAGKDFFVLNPGLAWRFDDEKTLEYVSLLQKEYKMCIEERSKIQFKEAEVQDLMQLWKSLIQKYPASEYPRLKKRLAECDGKLGDLNSTKQQLDNEISDLTTTKVSLEKESKEIRVNWELLQKNLHELELVQQDVTQKIQLELENNSLSQEISAVQGQEDSTRLEIESLSVQFKSVNSRIEVLNSEKSGYEQKLTQCKSIVIVATNFSKEKALERITERNLEQWWNHYEVLRENYDKEISSNELLKEISKLEKNRAELMSDFSLQCVQVAVGQEDPKISQFAAQFSSKLGINSRRSDLEQVIRQREGDKGTFNENKKKKQKEMKNLEKTFTTNKKNLQKKYAEILSNRSALKDERFQTEIDLENSKKVMDELHTSQAQVIKECEKISGYIPSFQSSLNVIEYNINSLRNEVDLRIQEQISLGHLELNIETFMDDINITQKDTVTLKSKKASCDSKCTDFVNSIHKLIEKVVAEGLDDTNLVKFLKEFNQEQIFRITHIYEQFVTRLNQVREEIKAPKERLGNITRIFSSKMQEILTKLKNLEKIKLPIPDMPHLDKKSIVKIQYYDREPQNVDETVNKYFNHLLIENADFPPNLTKRDMINEILEDYLEDYLKQVTFLFPDSRPITTYCPIDEIKRTSGGESITVAILLYCLVAYFRLQYLSELKTVTHSFPFLMDNPIGKANRLDLNLMQVSLAEKLRIQLIPFTGIKDLGICNLYDNLITLKKHKMEGENALVTFDEKESSFIQGSSVAVRPHARPKQKDIFAYGVKK